MLGRLLSGLRRGLAARKTHGPLAAAPSDSSSVGALLAKADGFHASGDYARAEAGYRDVLAKVPAHPGALHALGFIAHRSGDAKRAVDLFMAAIERDPTVSAYHNNCGEAYRALGEYDRAVACYRAAIAIAADSPHAYLNLGLALQSQGRIAEAISALERAVALSPDDADLHLGLSAALLVYGEYARGWKEYAWRRARPAYTETVPRLSKPRWTGETLAGGTILLYPEQGYGDAIQFARYAPLVADRCARVILKCHAALDSLFESISDRVEVIRGKAPVPHYDAHASLLDLPGIFGTGLDNIPASVPYLHVPVERVEAWRRRMQPWRGALRIGMTWAGNPNHANDRNRSCTLAHFSVLAEVEGALFISLQKDGAIPERAWPTGATPLLDLGPEIEDFSDTAAIIENLDLVISVDTSVAHLAGALAKPTWTLLAFPPDWRWLTHRADSPWYPTMRLFRQPRPGAWPEVFREVATALRAQRTQFTANKYTDRVGIADI